MYKQTATRKQLPTFAAIALIVLGVFVVYFIASLIVFLGASIGFPYLEYLVYALLVAGGVYLINHMLTSYAYALSETELLLEKYVGKRLRQREVVELSAVEVFCPYAKGQKAEGGTLRFAYGKKGLMALTVRADNTRYLIIFMPDGEMAKRLMDAVGREDDQDDQKHPE